VVTTPDPAQELLDRCVGENLDQLALVDLRGDGVARALYAAGRADAAVPVSLAAARVLAAARGPALLLTGFLVPPWGVPETDGLIGAAVLAAALDRAGAAPVFVAEAEVAGALAAAVRGAGLAVADRESELPHVATVLTYSGAAAELAARLAPAVCVAIERPGRNARGRYHFALGRAVEGVIAPIDDLYEEVRRAGVPTVAVGDFGNELGMGAVADAARRDTPAGAECGCGCGGGTVCEIGADVTFACAVSDWGAYAVAACLSHVLGDPVALLDAGRYRRVCEAAVAAGAIDGTSALAIPSIDGVDDAYNGRLLETMRAAVAYPNRSGTHGPTRLHRARTLEPRP
jgi:D-glutamate cyclase